MTIMLIMLLSFLSMFVGMVFGYTLLSWALRQDGYYIQHNSDKEIGDGRYCILQEVDLDLWSDDDE